MRFLSQTKLLLGSAAIVLFSVSAAAQGPASAPAPSRAPASVMGAMGGGAGVHESTKELKINGQTRNLNMMMVLKNDKNKIKFVEVRRNFKDEVPKTNY